MREDQPAKDDVIEDIVRLYSGIESEELRERVGSVIRDFLSQNQQETSAS